ncbi:MAG: NAD(P)/FAD-dependent oxidoreductase [Verrucomicrobiota bacterium]
MNADKNYEVVVIGGGSGGYSAASNLAELGISTALIEKADQLGGLCILEACMPGKAIIESANLMRRMRNSKEFGITTSDLSISMDQVQDRKNKLIGEFQAYRSKQLEQGDFDLIRGEAVFISNHEIEVRIGNDTQRIRFDYAVIATGSVPHIPELKGLDGVDFWLSHDALNSREIPEHLVIIGGGAIGCEMAHCFEGLGAKVTILQRNGCLLSDFDDDIGGVINEVSRKRGIRVLCSIKTLSVKQEGKAVMVEIERDGIREEIVGSHLLLATGRKSATENMGLEVLEIATHQLRIKVDEQSRSSCRNIFAIGDASDRQAVVHQAVLSGEIVARSIAQEMGRLNESQPKTLGVDYEFLGIFTHPQCARLGMTQRQIEEGGLLTESVRYPFRDHGKAQILGETEGFVKIVAEEGTGRILGASAVGPHVIDLIHELQVAIHAGLTVTEFAKIPHYHPTLAEIWTYPAQELSEL